MTETERLALYSVSCVLCGHRLIEHHETTTRCMHSAKRHWWSRRVQCPCVM